MTDFDIMVESLRVLFDSLDPSERVIALGEVLDRFCWRCGVELGKWEGPCGWPEFDPMSECDRRHAVPDEYGEAIMGIDKGAG